MPRSSAAPTSIDQAHPISRAVRRWLQIAGGLVALHLLVAPPVAAQSGEGAFAEAGHASIQSISSVDYDAGPANWAATQDPSGLLYVGNDDGVLVYDGVTWQTVMLSNRGVVRSLDVDDTGRVFVGGYDTFGMVLHGNDGPTYRSLHDNLPPGQRSFADVWTTLAASDGVYFVTSGRLFRWSEARGIESWSSDAPMKYAARLRQTVLVHQNGRGLAAVREGRLQRVPGTEPLADVTVHFMTSAGPDRLLLGTRTDGLFVFDGERLTRLPTAVDAQLDALQLYDGLVLPDGSIALATLRGGILWLSEDGRLRHVFDEAAGLPTSDVKALFYDDQDGLWGMMDNGLTRIMLSSPLTFFTEDDGFSGSVYTAIRHGGRLRVGTSQGVFVMQSPEAPGRPPRFTAIRGLHDSCQALLSMETELLAGCDGAIYRVDGDEAARIADPGITYALARSPSDPSRLYAGLNKGMAVLRRQDARWHLQQHVEDAEQVRMIVEDRRGNVWLGTNHGGLFRLRLDARDRVTHLDHYGRWAEERVHVFEVGGEPLFSVRSGLFRYAPAAGAADPFVPDTVLGATLTGYHQNIFRLSERSSGDLLLRAGGESGLAYRQEDGSYRWTTAALSRLPEENVYGFLAEDDGVSWVGGADGLFRHDAGVTASLARDFPVLVRRVELVDHDSTLYRGIEAAAELPARLAYSTNSVRFNYAAARLEAPEAVRYRVRLHGFDRDWSSWTQDTRKDYTNLPEGRYTFEVQAHDVYGHLSRAATVTFAVRPPWYRAWWAYGLYVLLGLGLFTGAVRWRSARLQERARQLEAEVQARTREVARQNVQLEAQAERLAALGEAKSRFLANLSHEFRTPLTLLLGPLQDALDQQPSLRPPSDDVTMPRPRVQAMLRNSQRLLRLINQILDLARLEAGTLTLDAHPHDVITFVRETIQAFTSLAERLGLTLTWEADAPSHTLAFDREKLEIVLANLLSNALKFTPEGGAVDVRVTRDAGAVHLVVRDTGAGIPAAQQSRVFDRFYQVDSSATRTHEGTGIGLALVKELVELHGGTISVASTPGAGSTFAVMLPVEQAGGRGEENEAERETRVPSPITAVPRAGLHEAVRAADRASLLPTEATVPAAPRSDAPDLDSPPDRTTVLVVDDNADVRGYVRSILEPAFVVLQAPDGRAGLAAAREHLPDLIVADVMMPEMDGLAFSQALKDDAETDVIPVILLTARAGIEDEVAGLSTGADDYVVKPFHAAALRARVDNLIALRRRLRERLREEGLAAPPDEPEPPARSPFEHEVRAAIRAHLTESSFTVEALAEEVALSRSQLHRRLSDEADVTPSRLIRTVRVEEAARLLEEQAGTVSEVAYAVGFESLSHFSRSFRAHFGVPPSRYTKTVSSGA